MQLAIFQCDFEAETSKPTRLGTNAISACETSPLGRFRGPPVLDDRGQYLGPLPQQCSHGFHNHKLIGKAADGSWNTGPAATYPPKLCEEIALLLVQHFLNLKEKGEVAGAKLQEGGQEERAELSGESWPQPEEEGPFHGRLERAATDNGGLPITCGWLNHPKSFCDGGGLCSPGRWRPKDRGLGVTGSRKTFVENLALLVKTFVVQKIQTSTFQLATGHMQQSPFSDEDLQSLRRQWVKLLGGSQRLLEVEPHQPFLLLALEETLRRMEDEDVEIISKTPGDNYVTGRRVGVGDPVAPAPLVFRPRRKGRSYDESVFQPEASNYTSAVEAAEIIQRQFEEEERLGWMYPISEAEARRRFGDRLRIASLAAIPKDEKTVRVLFDGTHSVQVNNEIKITDQLEFPTPSELARGMEISREDDWGVVFSIAADIMKAHRRFLHAVEDHGYLCCKADSASKVVWVNRVGTFGVACAALHFGRLAGLIFRMVIRLLRHQPCFQYLFADDLKWVVGGATKYLDLWMLIVGWLMVGTPFSWRKFRGGLALDYVGFWTDYGRFRLGLSEKRAQGVIQTIEHFKQSNFVANGRSFTELLGRLGFASQAVPWVRPMLGVLYAWNTVLTPFMAARMPGLVATTLELVQERFKKGEHTAACWSAGQVAAEKFRTDAKCEEGRIVLGGWELGQSSTMAARWFSFTVTADEAPWLYYRGTDVQKMSTAAEMLATYAALHAFGFLERELDHNREEMLSLVAGGTDNLANEQLARRRLTTKLPLGLLMLQLHTKLWDNGFWLRVKWRPREENTEADDLTNGNFKKFSPEKRIEMNYASLDMRLLEKLQGKIVAFETTAAELREPGSSKRGLTKRQKVSSRTDW